ncbi:peptidoglycan DD-metalloendopeptidase family protein [Streptomyces sp. NBC_00988]|uniref:peptidoglycan DD-metalloendopeptidase family protein n=1 Tax=Streptomyces sp. NBC_00988 TaxID=2903704 RepID=UPI003870D1AA|nr:peptidoglycan DD-metalloendopeptidase family protein [Streptomyces sp. NBC_00988]
MTTPAPASDATSAHYASYGGQDAQYGDFTTYGDHTATDFHPGAQATASFATDPLFGDMPGNGHGTGAHATGAYGSSAWSTGAQHTLNYDPYAAQHHATYDTGAYENTAWSADYQQLSAIPPQTGAPDVSGQWNANAWLQPDQSAHPAAAPADQTQQWEWGTQAFDTGAYDATQWNADGTAADATTAFEQTTTFEQASYDGTHEGTYDEPAPEDGELTATGEMPTLDEAEPEQQDRAQTRPELLDDQEEFTPRPAPAGSRAAARNGSRSRRRTPPKRSALMTIAVPSACVMGVAGIAAASVGTLTGGSDTTASASDATSVKPSVANNKLDAQIKSLSAGADDFADRASRTQERIDLKAQQEAEKKKAAAEAARKERLRPKYVLPVTQKGLSAYFGQAGVNWMSVHTGIDFPVSYGTTVMAATDGVVSTKWNSAYGNMLILTEKDGTQTWYCHLSSYRVASGTTVKAGDPIAYSGNSGNSTGPHLHFEVRPAGGAAIDPLPWLRSHGLDPT